MRVAKQTQIKPEWAALIKQARTDLRESQTTFGGRFGYHTAVAVHYWETGKREAPYAVTWWLHERLLSNGSD